MRKLVVVFVMFLTIMVIFSRCEWEDKPVDVPKPPKSCPTNESSVSWTKKPYSYGSWRVGNEGYDGYSSDRTANLKSTCGWKILGKEVGGYGNTYAVYLPPDTSVIFRWEYGDLYEIILSDKWKGSTTEGIKMGNSVAEFKKVYPEFVLHRSVMGAIDSTILTFPVIPLNNQYGYYFEPSTLVKVWFTSPRGKLKKILIKSF